jgi:hypothetical protein
MKKVRLDNRYRKFFLPMLLILSLTFPIFIMPFPEALNADAASTLMLKPNANGKYSQFIESGGPTVTMIWSDQFEDGDFPTPLLPYNSVSTLSILNVQSEIVHTGNYAMYSKSSGRSQAFAVGLSSFPNLNTLAMRLYVYFKTIPAAKSSYIRFLDLRTGSGIGNELFAVGIERDSSGNLFWFLHYLNGTTYYNAASSTPSVATGKWYCVELDGVANASSGEANLYVDSIEVISEKGISTGKAAFNGYQVGVGPITSTPPQPAEWAGANYVDLYIDDIILAASGPIGPEDRPALVNDSNDLTGFLVIKNTMEKETFKLDNTAQNGTIISVTAYMRVTCANSSDTAVFVWRTHSKDYETTHPFALSAGSFTQCNETKTVNPNTGKAWTWDEVNALEIGSRALRNGWVVFFSEYWIVVTYIPTS